MLLLRVGLNAPHRPPDIRNCGSLVNGLEILMDDYPSEIIRSAGNNQRYPHLRLS